MSVSGDYVVLEIFCVLDFNCFIPCSEPLTDCLKDVDLIPPFNRILLEVTYGKLHAWAIQNIRNILLEATSRFKEMGKYLGRSVVFAASENDFGQKVTFMFCHLRNSACPPADNHQ